jgi:hypothetical protein
VPGRRLFKHRKCDGGGHFLPRRPEPLRDGNAPAHAEGARRYIKLRRGHNASFGVALARPQDFNLINLGNGLGMIMRGLCSFFPSFTEGIWMMSFKM